MERQRREKEALEQKLALLDDKVERDEDSENSEDEQKHKKGEISEKVDGL